VLELAKAGEWIGRRLIGVFVQRKRDEILSNRGVPFKTSWLEDRKCSGQDVGGEEIEGVLHRRFTTCRHRGRDLPAGVSAGPEARIRGFCSA